MTAEAAPTAVVADPDGARAAAGRSLEPAGARRRRRAPDGALVLRSPRLGASVRVPVRPLVVTVAVAATALLVFAWSLSVGDFPVAFGDVLASLVGRGSADSDFIVRTLRLPRGLAALTVGAALGISGAIFQRIARNPLASPDIVGVTAGATACAVLTIVVLDGTPSQVTWGALAGSTVTSVAIYLLSYRRGVTGYRLVLVGIGATAMLTSVTSFLMTRAEVYDAQRAMVWLTGSLNGRGWEQVRPLGWGLGVLVPIALVLGRDLRLLDLGDDAARGLGARVEGVRSGLLLIGVALAALAVSCAGPIVFVALVSPQIARRLVGGTGAALLSSAAAGAALLVASDLVARRLFAPTELPAGIVTAVLGAPFLLWLLARADRVGSAG